MKNFVLVLLFLSACEKTHPAQEKASLILDALQFGDIEQVITHHVESTQRSSFCTEEFKRVIKKVERTKSDARCKELGDLSKEAFNQLSDEAKLTTKLALYSCSRKKTSCDGFTSSLLKESLEDAKWISQVKAYDIKRTIADEGSAVVYVELKGAFGMKRRTLKFKKVSSRWLLRAGLLD